MTAPAADSPPMTPRDRMEARLNKILPGPGHEKNRWLVMGDADEYAAWMAEQVARPDERWGPK